MNFKPANRYRVDKMIGSGSFSKIFTGHDIVNNEEVAMKIECINANFQQLENEKNIYENIQNGRGIPKIRCFIEQNDYKILVLELLGPSLEDFYEYCNRKFSLETVLSLATQMIEIIEFVHSKGYVHRDIKPSNFVMGLGKKAKIVYLIDYGLAKPYLELNSALSRRDDLEQLCYTLIYFLLGNLPWQGHLSNFKLKKYLMINSMKSLNILNIFPNLQEEFIDFLSYCRNLEFEEKPNYGYYKSKFQTLLNQLDGNKINKLDWI